MGILVVICGSMHYKYKIFWITYIYSKLNFIYKRFLSHRNGDHLSINVETQMVLW